MRKRKSCGDCARARLNDFAEKTPTPASHPTRALLVKTMKSSFRGFKVKDELILLGAAPAAVRNRIWSDASPIKKAGGLAAPAPRLAVSVVQTLTTGLREA